VLLVNTIESSRATIVLGGESVAIEQKSGFPWHGEATLTLRLEKPATFAVKVRIPAWATPMTIAGATARAGWAELPSRTWKDGEIIPVKFNLASRVEAGEYAHVGRAALAWGPFILAYEQNANPALPAPHRLGLTRKAVTIGSRPGEPLTFETDVAVQPEARLLAAKFFTFADAGTDRGVFRIWLRAPGADSPGPGESLLVDGQESRSRGGNPAGHANGSINDEDFESFIATFNGEHANEDWFAVTLARPVTARRIVFSHGKNFHDGGWFDTQGGKPRVQVQRTAGSPWETVGELDDYPATTATSGKDVEKWDADSRFTLQPKAPVTFVAVRVIGKPASGDNPRQAFASCTELQAFSQ